MNNDRKFLGRIFLVCGTLLLYVAMVLGAASIF